MLPKARRRALEHRPGRAAGGPTALQGPPARAVLAPLPRGQHRLPAATVSQSHRVRILRATAEVMMRNGYANTSVAQIVAEARISRAVFYEHFGGKQHALLEAQDAATEQLLDSCRSAFASDQPWPVSVWEALRGPMPEWG